MIPRLVRILVALAATSLVSPFASGEPELAAQSPTGKLQGHVRDSTGRPLPAAHVTVLGTAYEAVADSSGFYFINGIPSGRYEVEAHATGHKGTRMTGVRMRAGYTLTLDFAMTLATPAVTGAALQGFVRDSMGRAIQHARVTVVGTPARGVADGSGCYRIEGLPAGPATVRGSFVGYRPVEVQNVALTPGTTTRLDLVLVATPVTITVQSNAFENASIVVDTSKPAPQFGNAGRSPGVGCT